MIVTGLLIIALALGAVIGGIAVFSKLRGQPIVVRLVAALMPLSAAVACSNLISLALLAPRNDWNTSRLAPAVAMTRGYALYQDKDAGVMTTWIYGPAPALLTLPAAIATHPTDAVLIGWIITAICGLAPAVWLHLRFADPQLPGSRAFALLAMLLFLWTTLLSESLRNGMYVIYCDAPTVGLAACAVAVLTRQPRGTKQMLIAALCVVLACWCKQSALPILLVPPLYLLIAVGRKPATKQLLLIVIVGAVISAGFILSFGPSRMWFHMIMLPSRHGFRHEETLGRTGALAQAALDLARDATPTILKLIVVSAIAIVLRSSPLPVLRGLFLETGISDGKSHASPSPQPSSRVQGAGAGWIMLPMMAIALLPGAWLGYAKKGGNTNNFTLWHYFLAAAVTTQLVLIFNALSRGQEHGQPSWRKPAFLKSMLVLLVSGYVLSLWPYPQRLVERGQTVISQAVNLYDNDDEHVYRFQQSHPDAAYFPWNELATLLADGKLRHFEWGFVDRVEAGMPPSREQILAHIPGDARLVGFHVTHRSVEIMNELSSTPDHVARIDELPEFLICVYPAPLKDFVTGRPPAAQDDKPPARE